ncbi:MAG: hypothetical protein H0X01_07510 [Nitrospira sp.]|nr:hypothetical protein [Nitrospira sp.]
MTSDRLVQAVEGAGNILSSYHATVVPNGTLTVKAGDGGGQRSFWKSFK